MIHFKSILKTRATFCALMGLVLAANTLNGQDVAKSVSLNDYDISLATPAGWASEYPPGHDAVFWLVRNRESPSENRVSFEIRVGTASEGNQEDIGLERLQNDFKNPKKRSSATRQIAGETVPVTTYSFDAATFSDTPGYVAQAMLMHGGVTIELRWYGSVGPFTETAPEIDKILASIKWLHPDWKPSESQRAFLQAAQQITAGIAPVTMLTPQYEKAVSLDPNNTKARVALGLGYLTAGRVDDAFSQYQAVSQIDPSNPEAWIGMGNVALRKGDSATALKYYSNAANHAPTDDAAQRKMAVGLAYAHRYQEALAHAEMAKRLGWKSFPSLDYLIKTLKYQISQSGTSQ
jgi:tetratricopeptide (TPR) repeat protein